MAQASVKILHNSHEYAKTAHTPNASPDGTALRFSGRLEAAIALEDLSSVYATWIAISSREGNVTLTLPYDSGSETYTIEPGSPLLICTKSGDTFASDPSFAPAGTFADVEVMAYTGNTRLSPPVPAFLVLNAGRGITEDTFIAGSVTAWTDTRGNSLAPLPFPWDDSGETEPTLIASDPDFGGQPSVDFSLSGSSLFGYSGDDDVFSFMRGHDEDFTMMMIFKAPDDAQYPSSEQGLWNTSNATGFNGWRALIEGGYRHQTILAGVGTAVVGDDELAPKATVMIWWFDASADTLRVYWQGRWHAAETFTGQASGNDPTALQVGVAYDAAHDPRYFRGKIADLTLYNRTLDSDELSAYIADAVNNYGVDDTEVQGFPWLADVVNFHRANRGLTWADEEETDISTWYDTRTEVDSNAAVWTNGSNDTPEYDPNDGVLGQPAWSFDGVDDSLQNSFTGTAGDHFSGVSPGFTVTVVYYHKSSDAAAALLSQGSYASATLQGMTLFFDGASSEGAITYEVDNSANDDVIKETGTTVAANDARAIVFRGDGSNWWIDELDFSTGTLTSTTGAYGGTESSNTSAAMFMGAFTNSAGFMECVVAEMTSTAERKTNAEVATFLSYAQNRYVP